VIAIGFSFDEIRLIVHFVVILMIVHFVVILDRMNVQNTRCTVSEALPVWDLTSTTNCDSFRSGSSAGIFELEPTFPAAWSPIEGIDRNVTTRMSEALERTKAAEHYLADDDDINVSSASCFEVLISVDNDAQSGQNIVLRTIADDDSNTEHEMQVDNNDLYSIEANSEICVTAATLNSEKNYDVLTEPFDGKLVCDGSKVMSCLNTDESSRDAWHPRVGVFDKFYDTEFSASVSVSDCGRIESMDESSILNTVSNSESSEENKNNEIRGDDRVNAVGNSSPMMKLVESCSKRARRASSGRMVLPHSDSFDEEGRSDDEDRLTIVCDMEVDDEVDSGSRASGLPPNKVGVSTDEFSRPSCNRNGNNLSGVSVSSKNLRSMSTSEEDLVIAALTQSNLEKPLISGATMLTSFKRLNFKPLRKLIGNICIPQSSASNVSPGALKVDVPGTVGSGPISPPCTACPAAADCSVSIVLSPLNVCSSQSVLGISASEISASEISVSGISVVSSSSSNLTTYSIPIETVAPVSTPCKSQPMTASQLHVTSSFISSSSTFVDQNSEMKIGYAATASPNVTVVSSGPWSGSLLFTVTSAAPAVSPPAIDIPSPSSVGIDLTLGTVVTTDSASIVELFPTLCSPRNNIPSFESGTSSVSTNSVLTVCSQPAVNQSLPLSQVTPTSAEQAFIQALPLSWVTPTSAATGQLSVSSTLKSICSASPPLVGSTNITVSEDGSLTYPNITGSPAICDSSNPGTQFNDNSSEIIHSSSTQLLTSSQTRTLSPGDGHSFDCRSTFSPTLSTCSAFGDSSIFTSSLVASSERTVSTSVITGYVASPSLTAGLARTVSPMLATSLAHTDDTVHSSRIASLSETNSPMLTSDPTRTVSPSQTVGSSRTVSPVMSTSSISRTVSDSVYVYPAQTVSPVFGISPCVSTLDLDMSCSSSPLVNHSPTTSEPVAGVGQSPPSVSLATPSIVSQLLCVRPASVSSASVVTNTVQRTSRNKRKASSQTLLIDPDEEDACNHRIKLEKLDDGYDQSLALSLAAARGPCRDGVGQDDRRKYAAQCGNKLIAPRPQSNLASFSLSPVPDSRILPNADNPKVNLLRHPIPPLRSTLVVGNVTDQISGVPCVTMQRSPGLRATPKQTVTPQTRAPRASQVNGSSVSKLSFHTGTVSPTGALIWNKSMVAQNNIVTTAATVTSFTPPTVPPPTSSRVSTHTLPSVEQLRSPVTIVTKRPSPKTTMPPTKSARISASVSHSNTSSTSRTPPVVFSTLPSTTTAAGSISQSTASNPRTSVDLFPLPKSVSGVVLSAHATKNARRSTQFWTKFNHWFTSSALRINLKPSQAPADLHLPATTNCRICVCGDEFVTAVGLCDHYERKSFAVSFLCRCDRVARTFYNMCAFASFYKSHVNEVSSLGHLPAGICSMTILPVEEMPVEYGEMMHKRELERNMERESRAKAMAPPVTTLVGLTEIAPSTVKASSSPQTSTQTSSGSVTVPVERGADAQPLCLGTLEKTAISEPQISQPEPLFEVRVDVVLNNFHVTIQIYFQVTLCKIAVP